VPVLAHRIDPDEHTVHLEQLLSHVVGDLVRVNRGLDIEADVPQRLRDIAEPRLLEPQRHVGARIAGKHHGHSVSTLAHLMTLPRVERSRGIGIPNDTARRSVYGVRHPATHHWQPIAAPGAPHLTRMSGTLQEPSRTFA